PIGALSMSSSRLDRWPTFTPPPWPDFAPPLTRSVRLTPHVRQWPTRRAVAERLMVSAANNCVGNPVDATIGMLPDAPIDDRPVTLGDWHRCYSNVTCCAIRTQ
ncbi:hypothetical protein, partial [Sphingomonas sp. BE138]|uniref:hypothetical protein n=1 Tax=Sphingomonas sp. BE138 TaxID=2817845 RepID=UPI00286A8C44